MKIKKKSIRPSGKRGGSSRAQSSWSKIICEQSKYIFHFLTYEIWRISNHEVTGIRVRLYNLIKVIILSIRHYQEDNLQNKASALTYYTMLSIVPILTLLVAIARGFGLQEFLQGELQNYFEAQSELLNKVLGFVDSYLSTIQSGFFIGVGLLFLFWTAMSLIGTIEESFNAIWQVKKGRTYWRKITDYFSMLLILPVLLISSSGLSIFFSTHLSELFYFNILDPLVQWLFKLTPYFLTWVLFTCVYIYLPNTKVKLRNALLAGIVSGTAFQIFQYFYINGQIWVSKYNAIYGSFAAIPLLLLWLQLSWLIVLFGAELAFAGQNIENYNFESDSKCISARYRSFLLVVIVSIIAKRFAEGSKPYNAEEIARNNNIPIRLSRQLLNKLTEVGIIAEMSVDGEREYCYQPAVDIHLLSLGYLFDRIDRFGSENFKVDRDKRYASHWKVLLESRRQMLEHDGSVLLKDL